MKLYTIPVLLLIFPAFGNSQSTLTRDSLVATRIATLQKEWRYVCDISSPETSGDMNLIKDLFTTKGFDPDAMDNQKALDEIKSSSQSLPSGLEMNGGYYENFDTHFNSDDNLAFYRRLQAGLDWNLLSQGLISNRIKKQVNANENTIKRLQQKDNSSRQAYEEIYNKIIYVFNRHKIKVLEQRKDLYDKKFQCANDLYNSKFIARYDFMKVTDEKTDITALFNVYKSYNDQLRELISETELPNTILPLFDLEIEKIYTAYDFDSANDSILRLQQRNLELENNLANKMSLKAGLRYNYYDLAQSGSDRNFVSVGMGFSLPIPFHDKNKKALAAAEIKSYEYNRKNNESGKRFELLNMFYEFRYKLKQYYNEYEKLKNYNELIRVARVKDQLKDLEFNPLASFDLLDQALSCQIELLDLEQGLYLQLLRIKDVTTEENVLHLIHPLNRNQIKEDVKKDLAVYAWSGSIKKYPESVIISYLKSWKANRFIVSLKKETEYKMTLNYLLQSLSDNAIAAELMLSDNDWIKNPLLANFEERFKDVDIQKTAAIHLDLEPHQFEDWEINKTAYLDNYIKVLARAKTFCESNHLDLNVSVPVFYPENYLRDIYKYADHVYVMAYDHKDTDYIDRKTKEENDISKSKTIIALNGKNFTSLNELQKFISGLMEKLDKKSFAIHDMESMILLDKNSNTSNNQLNNRK